MVSPVVLCGGDVARAEALAPRRSFKGKELSYTNLLDLDAAARIVLEFEEPAAVVIKHTNPCGAATGDSIVDAYLRARDADSLAAFGGIVALNRPLDADVAEAIVSTFIEAVIAPSVAPAAIAILARKPNMRVVVAEFRPPSAPALELRSILGARFVQERDFVAETGEPRGRAEAPDGFRGRRSASRLRRSGKRCALRGASART